jgi:Zn finger protein HypA/HybF involved in hydrogenase expression
MRTYGSGHFEISQENSGAIPWETRATGAESVDEKTPLKPIKAILQQIRERTDYALKQIEAMEQPKSVNWKCTSCGYTKHFTKQVPMDTAIPCPKCKGSEFEIR